MSEQELLSTNENISGDNTTPRRLHDFFKSLREKIIDDDALWTNEIKANHLCSVIMIVMSLVLSISLILAECGVFDSALMKNHQITIGVIICLIVGVVLCYVFKGRRKWLKYVLLVITCFSMSIVYLLWSYRAALVVIIPVVLSTLYLSKRLTYSIATLMAILMLVGMGLSVLLLTATDLNHLNLPTNTQIVIYDNMKDTLNSLGYSWKDYLVSQLMQFYLPTMFIYIVVTIICGELAGRGKIAIFNQARITGEQSKLNTELSLATDIQAHVLPYTFPPFPERDEFDIYATTYPAKKVGGDFYDYFKINENEYALCMADASGKGVPAALIMMLTKTLIKNYAQLGMSPAEVFGRVNDCLLEGDDDGHFVTAWLGYYNIQTGQMRYANAGHNPPIYGISGEYTYLKMEPGLVLGGIPDYEYKESSLFLPQGSRLFLYTDGVTENMNPEGELFGEDRLFEYLRKKDGTDRIELLANLKKELDAYGAGCAQADDETMLVMDILKLSNRASLKVKAISANLDQVKEYVIRQAEKLYSAHEMDQLELAIEEVFINIVSYAYPSEEGCAEIYLECDEEKGELRIVFEDEGIPFNPLQKEAPAEDSIEDESSLGGLGIYLVRKSMDDVRYQYVDGRNQLCLVKKYERGNAL